MKKVKKNWMEWTVFGASLVLVFFTLAYLTYDAVTLGDAPPTMEVRTGTPLERPHNFILPVTVINHGDQTAEGVIVEVVLETNGEEKERAEFDIAFLPRRATREGWVTFQTDPRSAGQIRARVLGYEKP
jgi:uncharacterized protein (TIGR02588 family)